MGRVMIAGTHSGCGKTTITCAILQAFREKGETVKSFKCGPDYIDPMFHSQVMNVPSRNLDGFFCDDETLRYLVSKNTRQDDLCVIEGVMGYYDGVINSYEASSYAVAKATSAPVVLVIDCKGASTSVLATLYGFATFEKDAGIKGVIFNRLPEKLYPQMAEAVRERGMIPLGYFPNVKDAQIESRHLGLITPAEIIDIKEKLALLSGQAMETIDLDALKKLAESSESVETACPEKVKKLVNDNISYKSTRIAVAKDEAFCFYYQDNLDLLEQMGFELAYFSPLRDKHMPENIHGLILGGGYPELYARELAGNQSLLAEIKEQIQAGIPTHAECGGHMYLHKTLMDPDGASYEMVGVIDGTCEFTKRLNHFGYATMCATHDGLLASQGEKVRVHEFHRSISEYPCDGFETQKDEKSWMSYVMTDTLASGFPHIHYYANLEVPGHFAKAVQKYKDSKK